MPVLGQVHIDQALSDLSIMYMNENLIADDVFPPLPVAKRSDKYFVYSTSAFLSTSGTDAKGNPLSIRRPGTEAASIDYAVSTDNYYAEKLSLKSLVSDEELAYADNPLQPDIDATYLVTERIKLDNEVQVANKVGTRANYNAAYQEQLTTGSTGTSWAQYASANSNPFTDLKNGRIQVIKGIQRNANTLLLTVDSARTLADHPLYKDLYKFTTIEGQTVSGLSKTIRGLDVIEGFQQKNTQAENPTGAATTGDVWVDDQGQNMALVYYRTSNTGPRTMHFGRTFEAPDETTGVRGFQVRRYRWEILNGQYIEGSCLRDWKIIAKDANGLAIGGYLISGCTL